MLTAVCYLGSVGIGATRPRLFRADDGNTYVVKMMNNRLGTKVLANELLAARFAQAMGLCFPPADIIWISPNLVKKNGRPQRVKHLGPHFASLYIRDSKYVNRRSISKAANKQEMAGVILFDSMFYNVDRTWNSKNIIVCRENKQYRIYAIDNSHLFRRGRWTVKRLEQLSNITYVNCRRTYSVLLKHYLTVSDFIPYVQQVKNLEDWQLQQFIDDIPVEWLSDSEERNMLLRYIQIQRDRIEELADRIYRLIPDEYRRTKSHHRK